eukprot:GILI01027808.1.p1 GENE.GILI01027808.1~~GILI01027808.1.p1  ORF type:complete len:316 (-),score=51.09 GILI01027808.1:128-994(-)
MGCSGNGHNTSMSRFGQRYEIKIDADYATLLWNRCLNSLVEAVVYNGVQLGLALFTKIWFEWGRHVIRIRSITIHQNVLLTAQLMCAIMGLVAMSNAWTQGEILRRWMEGCDQGGRSNAMNSTPSIPLYAAVVVDLFFQVVTFCLYLFYGYKSCRLDYDILEVRPDGVEVINKRRPTFAINNVPHKRDRKYIEAYKAQIIKDEELEELTMDPFIITELEADDQRRLQHNLTTAQTNNAINSQASNVSAARPLQHLGTTTAFFSHGNPEGNSNASQLPVRRDRLRPGKR